MTPPFLQDFLSGWIGVELIYSFILILSSLMIYTATNDLERLTSYKGIRYFRLSFLFFAIAYFFRYSIRLVLFLFNVKEVWEFSPVTMRIILLSIFLYFSSMAIFFLLYSVMWKKLNSNRLALAILNILAIGIALTPLLGRSILLPFIINLTLLAVILYALFLAYRSSTGGKKSRNLFLLYLLLSIFWILNITDILIPRLLNIYKLLIYLISILLFMLILYRVLKKIGG
ncbi:MAG: hypothetical protein QXW00_02135 [Candidatus Woesearchaeota archaeon]